VKNHTISDIHSFQSEYQNTTREPTEVTGYLLATKTTTTHVEQQACTWKEESRTLILRSRDKETRYEVDIVSMISDMTTLAGEIVTLRAHISNLPSADEALRTKCTQLAVERDDGLSRLRESDRQLASARREESEMEASL